MGIAGGAEKCRQDHPKASGFDVCLDHHADDFAEQLAKACPKGVDIYYENVGGKVFDAVLPLLNTSARIPACGLVSSYNVTTYHPLDRFTSADGYGAEKTYSLARIYYRSGS